MAIPGLAGGRLLELSTAVVAKSQTNAQGHLKAAEYVCLFDDASMVFFPMTGLADADLRHGGASPFLMDMHVCYLTELAAGEVIAIAIQYLSHDTRRARLMLSMRAAADGRPAATAELLLVNMRLAERKPAPWSALQQGLWRELADAHASLPQPAQAGRAIGPLGV